MAKSKKQNDREAESPPKGNDSETSDFKPDLPEFSTAALTEPNAENQFGASRREECKKLLQKLCRTWIKSAKADPGFSSHLEWLSNQFVNCIFTLIDEGCGTKINGSGSGLEPNPRITRRIVVAIAGLFQTTINAAIVIPALDEFELMTKEVESLPESESWTHFHFFALIIGAVLDILFVNNRDSLSNNEDVWIKINRENGKHRLEFPPINKQNLFDKLNLQIADKQLVKRSELLQFEFEPRFQIKIKA